MKEKPRCQYELFVEEYFGFDCKKQRITESTMIQTDFGQLVNLLATFTEKYHWMPLPASPKSEGG